MNPKAVIQRHHVAACFALSYAIVWAGGLLAIWLNGMAALARVHGLLLAAVMLLGPGLAAGAIIAASDGKHGQRDRPTHPAGWWAGVRVYAAAPLMVPLLIADGLLTIMIATAPAYQADHLYERAVHRSRIYTIWAALRGRSARLLDLATVTAHGTVVQCHSIGLRAVPIRQIRGSEGRCRDFDDVFHPLQYNTESRWNKIARAWLQGAHLPPVELIRVGDIYLVRDGHHRISVARTLGQQEIDANVTVWQVKPALPYPTRRRG